MTLLIRMIIPVLQGKLNEMCGESFVFFNECMRPGVASSGIGLTVTLIMDDSDYFKHSLN